ncbi:MAG: hyaluronoglucosaminidase, partial [Solirubrobacteraceae bacterium]|nr:hyaluronoglucosaminidase [Solirubrobacteraceae bacterium]
MRRLAIAALAAMLLAAAGAASASAASPFAWRGVIEGPYGPPWDHAARQRVLAFMAHHDFNAYVHAPKEDLYQRTQWRDPYPAAQQAEFNQEIAYARARGIEWIANLSPGLPLIPTPGAPQGVPSQDICYSCPAEIDVLFAKFQPFWNAGERTFMLSFDDVQKVLTHPEDIAAYGTGDNGYGKANGDLLSRFYRALRARDPAARLLSVGADYTGSADTPYLTGLRATLDPGVELMWTGPGTYSVNFTPEQVGGYARAAG